MNKYMQEAKSIRAGIEAFSANQTDESLIDNMAAFPYWNGGGVSYSAGMLLQYDGSLYRVVQPHTSQADWTPDDAYGKGDKVAHNGKHWQSDIDGNVWEPGVYGWSVEE